MDDNISLPKCFFCTGCYWPEPEYINLNRMVGYNILVSGIKIHLDNGKIISIYNDDIIEKFKSIVKTRQI